MYIEFLTTSTLCSDVSHLVVRVKTIRLFQGEKWYEEN
jgi:hypothetical protein